MTDLGFGKGGFQIQCVGEKLKTTPTSTTSHAYFQSKIAGGPSIHLMVAKQSVVTAVYYMYLSEVNYS